MGLVIAMGHIEADHIHSCFVKCFKHLKRRSRGADGAYDFGASHEWVISLVINFGSRFEFSFVV